MDIQSCNKVFLPKSLNNYSWRMYLGDMYLMHVNLLLLRKWSSQFLNHIKAVCEMNWLRALSCGQWHQTNTTLFIALFMMQGSLLHPAYMILHYFGHLMVCLTYHNNSSLSFIIYIKAVWKITTVTLSCNNKIRWVKPT